MGRFGLDSWGTALGIHPFGWNFSLRHGFVYHSRGSAPGIYLFEIASRPIPGAAPQEFTLFLEFRGRCRRNA